MRTGERRKMAKPRHDFILKEKTVIPVSAPETQGIPSSAIIHFLEEIEARDVELDSIQIVRNGYMVFDLVRAPYTHDSFHRIYSAAKGIVATAVLFAIQDGLFGINDKVIPLLPPEWIPEVRSEKWDRLTVYHLLTMTTGHDRDTMMEMWKRDCWIRTFFEVDPVYEPGTYFLYDMGAQYVMNEIIARATKKTVGEYLEEKLFAKIGVEYTNNFTEPEGNFFSSTMQLKPDGLTRLALFYLQKGKWNGEQLLREDLAVLAGEHHGPSSHYAPGRPQNPAFAGYALHMWRNKAGGFRFDGGQGQFGLVLPEENMAVGIMSCANNAGVILDLFFDTVFADCYNHPLEEDPYETAKLSYLKDHFSLAPLHTAPHSEAEGAVSGKTYVLQDNPWGQEEIRFTFGQDRALITVRENGTEKTVSCGLSGQWESGSFGYILTPKKPEEAADTDRNLGFDYQKTMYSGGWSDPDTFRFYMRSESLLCDHRYECVFMDDVIELRIDQNVIYPRRSPDRKAAPKTVLYGKAK